MTRKFPPATPCRISVTLRGGEVACRERDFSRGDPHDPLSDDEVSAKLRGNLDRVASSTDRGEILTDLWNLEELEDLSPLLAPLKQDLTTTGAQGSVP
ncbi:hypothetical protein ACL02U_14410 [Streptomyces sp. MS06]|uniref:hypothetical protein n=1 Tax=Streptomyces sp. MS06 TaxID=3385974 RepID=UPI0039A1D1FE